jgi:hypothetical protein
MSDITTSITHALHFARTDFKGQRRVTETKGQLAKGDQAGGVCVCVCVCELQFKARTARMEMQAAEWKFRSSTSA